MSNNRLEESKAVEMKALSEYDHRVQTAIADGILILTAYRAHMNA